MARTVSEHPGDHHHRYTHGHDAATIASHSARTAVDSAAYLVPVLTAGMSLLDVGCGPGSVTLDLARLVSPGQVVGCDSAPEALEAARATAAASEDTVTRFVVGDALGLPFDDDSFDVVHAHQVLHHMSDPAQALREMARVARPGGWVAARDADYGAMVWYPDVPGLQEWRALYPVSYAHLDVYKRQGPHRDCCPRALWSRAAGSRLSSPPAHCSTGRLWRP